MLSTEESTDGGWTSTSESTSQRSLGSIAIGVSLSMGTIVMMIIVVCIVLLVYGCTHKKSKLGRAVVMVSFNMRRRLRSHYESPIQCS